MRSSEKKKKLFVDQFFPKILGLFGVSQHAPNLSFSRKIGENTNVRTCKIIETFLSKKKKKTLDFVVSISAVFFFQVRLQIIKKLKRREFSKNSLYRRPRWLQFAKNYLYSSVSLFTSLTVSSLRQPQPHMPQYFIQITLLFFSRDFFFFYPTPRATSLHLLQSLLAALI